MKGAKHGRNCQCPKHFALRRAAFLEKVRLMDQPRQPEPDQLVPVRAHWRRNSRAYRRDALLKEFAQLIVEKLQATPEGRRRLRLVKK